MSEASHIHIEAICECAMHSIDIAQMDLSSGLRSTIKTQSNPMAINAIQIINAPRYLVVP